MSVHLDQLNIYWGSDIHTHDESYRMSMHLHYWVTHPSYELPNEHAFTLLGHSSLL